MALTQISHIQDRRRKQRNKAAEILRSGETSPNVITYGRRDHHGDSLVTVVYKVGTVQYPLGEWNETEGCWRFTR